MTLATGMLVQRAGKQCLKVREEAIACTFCELRLLSRRSERQDLVRGLDYKRLLLLFHVTDVSLSLFDVFSFAVGSPLTSP
jgi:hypothetical protein